MKFCIPEFSFSENEMIWIRAVYDAENNGEGYNYAKIRTETFKQIEKCQASFTSSLRRDY